MPDAVIAAIITGVLAVVGEIVIAAVNNRVMMEKLDKQSQLADARLEKAQAITDTKLEELSREVREHNNFAQRLPAQEEQIKTLFQRIEAIERRGA